MQALQAGGRRDIAHPRKKWHRSAAIVFESWAGDASRHRALNRAEWARSPDDFVPRCTETFRPPTRARRRTVGASADLATHIAARPRLASWSAGHVSRHALVSFVTLRA